MIRTICLHGPESTGKSTLARQLSAHYGAVIVPEYGRVYCEQNGTDITMADLVTIARTHDIMTQATQELGSDKLILDTDPLMTAVWADMMFGKRDPWFDSWQGVADLYLLMDIDLLWEADGTRIYGKPEDRRRFFNLCRAELKRRSVRWAMVRGTGPSRLATAIRAIETAQ